MTINEILARKPDAIILKTKFNSIKEQLKKTDIVLDFTKSAIKDVTIKSTLQRLKTTYIAADNAIRELLPGIVGACQEIGITSPFQDKNLITKLKNIAPQGLAGVELDLYYVLQSLIFPQQHKFCMNVKQQHQWEIYAKEINYLLTFFVNKNYDFSILLNNPFCSSLGKNYINVPVSKFLSSSTPENPSMSENTFSRFINVVNEYVPLMWTLVLQDLNIVLSLSETLVKESVYFTLGRKY